MRELCSCSSLIEDLLEKHACTTVGYPLIHCFKLYLRNADQINIFKCFHTNVFRLRETSEYTWNMNSPWRVGSHILRKTVLPLSVFVLTTGRSRTQIQNCYNCELESANTPTERQLNKFLLCVYHVCARAMMWRPGDDFVEQVLHPTFALVAQVAPGFCSTPLPMKPAILPALFVSEFSAVLLAVWLVLSPHAASGLPHGGFCGIPICLSLNLRLLSPGVPVNCILDFPLLRA